MAKDSLKRSAVAVAFLRSIATYSPDTQLFEDPYAEYFLPMRYRRWAKRSRLHKRMARTARRMEVVPRLRRVRHLWRIMSGVLLRARYTEDVLERRIEEGVRQYIILGAGMDSFVFRRPDLMQNLTVFELDLPSTQGFKLDKIKQANLKPPPNVVYLPINFEKSSVTDVLRASNFDPTVPTLIGWNGVTYYLPKEIIESMLSDLSDFMGDKIEIVFDYAESWFFDRPAKTWWRKTLRYLYQFSPEPLVTGFSPAELETLLQNNGFTLVENCTATEQKKLYDEQVRGIFTPSDYLHLAHVRGVKKTEKSVQAA